MLLKAKQFFKNIFIILRLKYFYDSLHIVAILAPGCEVFSVKCAKFPLIFKE